MPSNVSANDCRLCWQRAVFLPVTFQADDAQALTKVVVMEETALHKDSEHLQGMKDGQNPDL